MHQRIAIQYAIGVTTSAWIATISSDLVPSLHSRVNIHIANLGGADRDRTGGLLVANQALSQLSYSPLSSALSFQSISKSLRTEN